MAVIGSSLCFQVLAAQKRGLHAVAIHQDSLNEAQNSTPPRHLFKEASDGLWDILFFSPEMLGFIFVDECHVVVPWGNSFRDAYKSLEDLRPRVPSNVTWGAFTATLSFVNRSSRFKIRSAVLSACRIC